MTVKLLAKPEDFAAALGVTYDPDDLAMANALAGASDLARRYCNRVFDYADDEILLDGSGTDTLVLPESPVYEVSAIEVTEWTNLDPDVLDEADFVVSRYGVLSRIDEGWFCRGKANVAIAYSHGYTNPNDSPISDVDPLPADVQQAVMAIAARVHANAGGQAVKSETIGTYSVEYANAGSAAEIQATPEARCLEAYVLPHR
jgi:hypothetical protein